MSKTPPVVATQKTPSLNWLKIIVLSLLLAIGIAIAALLLTTITLGWVAWAKLQPELKSRNLDLASTIDQVKTGWNQTPVTDVGHFNVLVLGVDSLANRGNVPPLTDTMMLVSFNTQTQKVALLPLPRDLWLDEPRTKINALYAYGLEQNPQQPMQLVTTTLSKTTNLPIHRTVLITLDQLEDLIDLVGGVQINVPEGFTDPLFPRTDVDLKTAHTQAELYESVTFVPGQQTMSGAMALKYIRSRHSKGVEGTDVARGQRQQLVIESLVAQLASPQQYRKNPLLLLDLWQWYNQNFASTLNVTEATSLVRPIIETGTVPAIAPVMLPIMTKDRYSGKTLEPGVLFNPPIAKDKYLGQWVYVIPDLTEFQNTVKKLLYND